MWKCGEKGGFWPSRDCPPGSGNSTRHTSRSHQFGLHFPFPEGFLALIREKTALLFWEFAGSWPIRLLEAELQLEITANSTYWKANLRFDQPYLPIREKNPCFEGFPQYPFYNLYQANQVISLPENFQLYII
jgi:hypothetical protein